MDTHGYWPQRLVSPVWVSVREAGDLNIPDQIYDKAAGYEQEVCRAIRDFRTEGSPSSDLMTYFSWPEDQELEAAIRAKVHAAQLTACVIGDSLYAALDLDLSGDLTEAELDAFICQMEGQYRDGWGAQFETVGILTARGQEISVQLDNPDLAICPVEAVQMMEQRDAGRSGPQMGQIMQ